jgi:hypothetical protein
MKELGLLMGMRKQGFRTNNECRRSDGAFHEGFGDSIRSNDRRTFSNLSGSLINAPFFFVRQKTKFLLLLLGPVDFREFPSLQFPPVRTLFHGEAFVRNVIAAGVAAARTFGPLWSPALSDRKAREAP